MRLKVIIFAISFLPILFISGCSTPPIDLDMGSAKERFKQNRLKIEEDDDLESIAILQGSEKINSVLLRFRYGPDSLEDKDFIDYLSSLNLQDVKRNSSLEKKKLTDYERGKIDSERLEQRRLLIQNEKQKMLAQLQMAQRVLRNFSQTKQAVVLNLRNVPLTSVLEDLAQKENSQVIFSPQALEKSPLVTADLNGQPDVLFEKLVAQYKFNSSYDRESRLYRVYAPNELRNKVEAKNSIRDDIDFNILSSDQQLSSEKLSAAIGYYRNLVQNLTNENVESFLKSIQQSSYAQSNSETQRKLYSGMIRDSSELQSKLNYFDRQTNLQLRGFVFENKDQKTVTENVMNFGTLDDCIKPGKELYTEKLYVYREFPKYVAEQIRGYVVDEGYAAMGYLPGQYPKVQQANRGTQNQVRPQNNAVGANQASGQAPLNQWTPQNPGSGGITPQTQTSGQAPLNQWTPQNSGGTPYPQAQGQSFYNPAAAPLPQGQSPMGQISGQIPRQFQDPITGKPICSQPAMVVQEDATGIIVTGTREQIQLAKRLASTFDITSKQVLIEVFMVEVDKNWQREIQSKIGGQSSNPTSSGGVGGNVTNFPTTGTNGLISVQNTTTDGGFVGQFIPGKGYLTQFLNLLESNNIGRKISSPTILAKDGQTATVNRDNIVRSILTQQTTVAGTSPVTTNSQNVIDLNAPLVLKVTPRVNHHNNHVSIDFDFNETVYDTVGTPTITSPTISNSIATTLESAPGDVIVLAGLYKETNGRTTTGLPGTTGFGALTGLIMGSDALSTKNSELLVFIAPTVIEPVAGKTQINSVR
jgi:type II secretory pathway component GspD/PulD (secretin)